MIKIRIIVQIIIFRIKIKILIKMMLTLNSKVIIFSNKTNIQSSLFQKEKTIFKLGKNRGNSVLKDLKTIMNMGASWV